MFKKFKSLIENCEFYEAHEVLEEYWHTIRKTDNPHKNIYRGFINAAVAMELKRRGRNNYKKVWFTYEKYKPLYKEEKKFVEVMEFLDSKRPF